MSVLTWLVTYRGLLTVIAGISTVVAVATVLIIPLVIARLPADLLLDRQLLAPLTLPPPLRWLLSLGRNLAGAVLLLVGFILLFLPGQGLLTILVGLMTMDFPGKRDLELSILRRPRVVAGMNWIRARAGKPPFLDPSSAALETEP